MTIEYQIIYKRFEEHKPISKIAIEMNMTEYDVKRIIIAEVREIEYWRTVDLKPVYKDEEMMKYWKGGRGNYKK
jgi:predicted transcriptional regulator